MKNKLIIQELGKEDLVVFEKNQDFPKVFVTKSNEWHLYTIKEICTTKNKRLALKTAQNVIELMKCKK
jgi:hypothetical protein